MVGLVKEEPLGISVGNTNRSLVGSRKAISYHEKYLKNATGIDDRAKEGADYGNLGSAYQSLGNQ